MKRILSTLPALLAFSSMAFGINIVTNTLPTGNVGNPYQTQLAASGNTGYVIWQVYQSNLPPGFVLDASNTSSNGTLCYGTSPGSGQPVSCSGAVPQADQGSWTFTIQAIDSQTDASITKQFSLSILTPQPPSIFTSSPLPNATVGQSYSFQLTGQGGVQPYTWYEFSQASTFPASFSLCTGPSTCTFGPPGTLYSAQVTPQDFSARSGGVYTFTIGIRDSNGATNNKQFSLTITQGLTITTTSPLPSGTVNVAYQSGGGLQLTATGGSGSYQWSITSGSLPQGMGLSAGGLISGTPTAPVSQQQFTVQVTDVGVVGASAPTATKTFVISVVSSSLVITQSSLPAAFQNQSYSTTLTAQGGQPPYTWSLGTNQVTGLSIGASTGVLSGTPTNAAGTYSITIIVQDSAGGTYQNTFQLQVASSLTITTKTLPNGTQGQSYSQTVNAGGGQGPYTWSLSAGSLPPGLTLQSSTSSSVTISGTPTQGGTFSFTMKVVDSESPQQSATQALQIQVGGNVTITTTTLPDGSQGVTYNQVVGATGGQTPYTWTVSSGSLPAGLNLVTNADSTATISGTPTGQGPSTFTLQVTDAQKTTATQSYTINIGISLSITTSTVPNGTVGSAYSQPLGATGGTPPYTWSVLAGTLPAGITLATNNGLLSGTPTTAGNYSFTIQVRDSSGATAQRAYSISIIANLSLRTGTFNGTVGQNFTLSLSASGGASPYRFSIQSGSLPPGVSLNTDGTISGVPTTSGTYAVVVQVTDAGGNTASGTITIIVALGAPPTLTIGQVAPTPGQQPALALTLAGTFPTDLNGTVVLTFLSSVGGDDLTVGFTNGARTATFTIPAGTSKANFPTPTFGIRTGTVAGTITIAITSLSSGSTPVTPIPSTPITIVIPPSPPVITAVSCASSSSGFTVSVTGFTTTRNMVSGTFNFTPPSGGSLANGSSSVLVQLAQPFVTWFSGSSANATGGQFTLTAPFTVSSGSSASGIGVTVGLANSAGGSNISAAANCQ